MIIDNLKLPKSRFFVDHTVADSLQNDFQFSNIDGPVVFCILLRFIMPEFFIQHFRRDPPALPDRINAYNQETTL